MIKKVIVLRERIIKHHDNLQLSISNNLIEHLLSLFYTIETSNVSDEKIEQYLKSIEYALQLVEEHLQRLEKD